MKKVISLLVILCFMLSTLGVMSAGAKIAEYDIYTLKGTFEGAKEGDYISVFVLRDGYSMSDLSSVSGSVLDKVYYTNIFEAEKNGAFSVNVMVPHGTNRSALCVLSCNGTVMKDTLRSFLVSSGSLTVIYAKPGGTESSKNNGGSKENPYALTTAKNKAVEAAATTDVDVLLMDGNYNYQGSRLQIQDVNQGTGHRITFTAASKDDKPVITSMKQVGHQYITKLTEGEVYNRLPEKTRGMVYKLDMKAAGFADEVPIVSSTTGVQTGTYSVLSMNYAGPTAERRTIEPPILYFNGNRQRLSQYPNEASVAFDNVSKVVGTNSDGNPTLNYSQFVDKMDFGKWAHALDDLFIAGYIFDSYRAASARITAVDATNKVITVDGTASLYYPNTSASSAKFGPRITVVNLPEEMDIPGEYYFNKDDKCIYYYAPYELTADDVFEMANDTRSKDGKWGYPQLLFLTGSENITFDGIEFYGSRYDSPIYVSNCNGIIFRNCTIHATSEQGMLFSGKNSIIENCNVYDTGAAGLSVTGALCVRLDISEPSNNIVRNNHVYNYSQNPTMGFDATGIVISKGASSIAAHDSITYSHTHKAVGDTAENNLIHGSKFAGALRYAGLRTTVRRNEMYNVLDSTDDIGVVYIGRSVTEFGNQLTENYIHDFYTIDNPRYSTMAIYWDDYQSGQRGSRNIVVAPDNKISELIGIRTIGYNNQIKGNTFVNIYSGIGLSGRSPDSWTSQNSKWGIQSSLNYLPHESYEYYDEMVEMREVLNSRTDGKFVHMAKAINNLTVDCQKSINISSSTNRVYQYGRENVYGNETGDMSIFVDPANQDYRVKKEYITEGALSEVPNEENFDMDWIGIQTEMPDADQSFKLMHPSKGEILTKDNVILTWEQGLFADKYEYVIATDAKFANIVETGETKETFVIPSTTFVEGDTYYWKVKAINFSRDMGSEWMCSKIESFSVGKKVDFDLVENEILSEDGTTIIRSLKGVKNFDYKYTVKNDSASSQEFIIIAALYSDEGKFQQARISESATVEAGKTASGTLEFFSSTETKEGYYVKAIVVDNPKTFKPLGFFETILKK